MAYKDKGKAKEYRKQYNIAHKEEIRAQNRAYRESHRNEDNERSAEYYTEHKRLVCERNREYYQRNRQKILEREKKYRATHTNEMKKSREEHREYILKWHKKYRENNKDKIRMSHQMLKMKVLTYYGNGRCACVKCGFDDVRALSIDHINGGGRRHQREIATNDMYRWLRKNGYPVGYQTLCMNCQWIKKDMNKEVSAGAKVKYVFD